MIFTTIARCLCQFNSTVNPMVYATTVPDFKTTLWKILRLKKGKPNFTSTEMSTSTAGNTGNKDKTSSVFTSRNNKERSNFDITFSIAPNPCLNQSLSLVVSTSFKKIPVNFILFYLTKLIITTLIHKERKKNIW